jgi:hypothetical protein
VDRIESELPKLVKSSTEVADPKRVEERRETHEPNDAKSKTDNAPLNRAKLRTETELPKDTKSRIEVLFSEPPLLVELSPIFMLLRMLNAEPRRLMPRQERVEPRFTKLKIEAELPNLAN